MALHRPFRKGGIFAQISTLGASRPTGPGGGKRAYLVGPTSRVSACVPAVAPVHLALGAEAGGAVLTAVALGGQFRLVKRPDVKPAAVAGIDERVLQPIRNVPLEFLMRRFVHPAVAVCLELPSRIAGQAVVVEVVGKHEAPLGQGRGGSGELPMVTVHQSLLLRIG